MITKTLMESLFPTKGLNPSKFNLVRDRDELIDAMNRLLPKYGINSYLRVCAFLGNCGIETDYFRTTIEYASGADYEGRTNLGNTQKGDGRRFKGRGLTQTTGRSNYEAVQQVIGAKLGIDVVRNPEKLAEIEIAVESACIFWKAHNLNERADRGEFKELSAIVNRGDKTKTPLHWAKRNELYSLCKRRIPKDFSFAPQQLPIVTTVVGDSSYTTQLPDTDVAQSNQPGVLTPSDDGFNLPDLNIDTARQRLSDGVEIVKRPGVKSVLKVIVTKVVFYLTTVWELGLSGKVALVLGSILALSSVAYTVYHYRIQIKSAFVKLKAAVLNSARKPA